MKFTLTSSLPQARSRFNMISLAAVMVTTLVFAPKAKADQYNFTFAGAGVSASGILTVTESGTPGTYDVTGISGTFSDTINGISGAITGLGTVPTFASAPSGFFPSPEFTPTTADPTTAFSYDDLFYPDGLSPAVCVDAPTFSGGVFDIYGVSFVVNNTDYVDMWSQGVQGGDMMGDSKGADRLADGVSINLETSPVPEPSSLLLLGTGLVGSIGAIKRRISASKA